MRREGRPQAHLDLLTPNDQVLISTITRGEILYGLGRMPPGQRRRHLEREAMHLFVQFPCQSLADAIADVYARIKLATQRQGTTVDENDLWIAATALHLGAVLVTADSDFQRVPGLVLEDWTR
jgi:tRNA(fMet)-specific endonuclease VapC